MTRLRSFGATARQVRLRSFGASSRQPPVRYGFLSAAAFVVVLGAVIAARAEEVPVEASTSPVMSLQNFQTGRARDLLAEGRHAEAAEVFERVLVSTPTAAGALAGLAEARLGAGELSRAETVCERLLDIDDENAEARVLLGRIAFERKDYKKTLKYCKKALKYDPHFAPAYFWRGRAYEALGKPTEAKSEYHAASLCNRDPDSNP